jgi:hypothetical protein
MPNVYQPMGSMNSYDPSMPQGASAWSAPTYGGEGDINPDGASNDPFAYTNGSLLTPWAGRFNSSGYGGGASAPTLVAPDFTPFNYADINFNAPHVGQFGENYQDPAAFRFADFQGPSNFVAPTAEAMKADPGYQARMDAVKNAQVAGAAHGGVLRSGGFQKGLARAVGDQASQEYGNVYARQAGEHDRLRKEAESTYGINQGATKQAFDTNVANKLAGYQTRQGAWRDNADVGLREGELGYNVATGVWDRNSGKARMGWEDQDKRAHELADIRNRNASAAASAASSNANMAYERDLGDYMRARDEFWTNQDRQYGILDREANRGITATNAYGNQMMGGYSNLGDYAVGGANARASGTMGAGNAWGGFAGDIGNTVGGLAAYGGVYGGAPQTAARPMLPSRPTTMNYSVGYPG